eukprot:6214122-Pleurochrysis_carterae.AAC.1
MRRRLPKESACERHQPRLAALRRFSARLEYGASALNRDNLPQGSLFTALRCDSPQGSLPVLPARRSYHSCS